MPPALNSKANTLHELIQKDDAKLVEEFLVSLGPQAQEVAALQTPRAGTALHLAAKMGNRQIVELLLKSGVSASVKQEESNMVAGITPLHLAATYSHFDVAQCLLEHHADVNARDADGQTPLIMACQQDNVDIVKLVLSKGADVNLKGFGQRTALQCSILRAPTETSLLLIKYGADKSVLDEDGQSSLHYASEWGNHILVDKLLQCGCNVNLQDHGGNTPLHVAQTEEVQQILIKNGADTSIRNKKAKPPIESKIDTETEEMQNINRALSRHLEKAEEQRNVPIAPDPQRIPKFAPKPVDANLRDLKTSLLGELQRKRALQE